MDGDEEDLYLPIELIIQILLKLPVKSLIRFKCVCKSWFSLISQPHFANSHFQLTANAHTPRILFINPDLESLSIDFETSLHDDSASYSPDISFLFEEYDYDSSSSSDMDFSSPHPSFLDLDIRGSCRGFILCSGYSSLYLWNPSTGVHRQIPFTTVIDSNLEAKYFYGFGYDESTDDYLVLSMCYDPSARGLLSHLGLFSLRANTWKEMEGGDNLRYSQQCMYSRVDSLLNGVIHWLAFHYDRSMNVIVGFHLTERKLIELPLPIGINNGPRVYDLWLFRGCLSLFDMCTDNGTVEIWVMKKYNVQSSWTKTLVLSFGDIPIHYFCPKYCTKSGDIVGTDDNVLAKYNDKGQLLEHHSYSDHEYGSLVVMYTESLLSLPGGDSDQA
ncbi:putative F-box domain, galactose oxidase/kelch, beta-propeller, F-box associated interaction [Medicago truncatula]|uniref:F-box protein interaction domain protein n=1 Tax=Medicago truncatula TaxID=3880 RepID=G7K6D2_MEDTR|nr:F-box/kelch-repeat protein At3g23880 [Medicago truncatula]AES98570.1 F-box protein interaction domain protein [Medicago truncatula]RHN56456.1 putative F-box domain, galactose oxidase/kelch, beta-propeller, F-box associated interaction [Medicago truncatula]